MTNIKKRQKPKTTPHRNSVQPFIVHVRELRQRLIYIVLSLVGFGTLGYFLQERIITILLRPAADQQFIYTTAGGGFNFLVTVCIYFGLACSVPLIMYQLFRFLEPLFQRHSRKFIVRCAAFSAILAALGALFGYYIGLPAALKFLLHQFRTDQIQPLLTIQDYVSFVMIYIVGFALLFQIPLILLFINRITRLRPRKLLGYQRFVVAGAFIAAAIITPSGDMVNQLIMAGPIIAMYQFGVAGVWFYNYRSKHDHIAALRAQDAVVQAARQSRPRHTPAPAPLVPVPPAPAPEETAAVPAPRPAAASTVRWLDTRPPVRARLTYFDDVQRTSVNQ